MLNTLVGSDKDPDPDAMAVSTTSEGWKESGEALPLTELSLRDR